MTYPIAKILIVAKTKGYNRTDVQDIIESFRVYDKELKERLSLSQDEIADILNRFIEQKLTPLGFNIEESFSIVNSLTDLYGDPEVNIEGGVVTRDQAEIGLDGESEEEEESVSSLNVLGKFMMYDDDGAKKHYSKNDVVYYEGKTYVATDDVSGWVPESMHPDNKWKPVDLPDDTIDGAEF